MTSYYVYDNWTINKAIVHVGSCTYCRDGRGLHGTGATRNSKWHGPFQTAAEALAKAKACKRERTDACSRCAPA